MKKVWNAVWVALLMVALMFGVFSAVDTQAANVQLGGVSQVTTADVVTLTTLSNAVVARVVVGNLNTLAVVINNVGPDSLYIGLNSTFTANTALTNIAAGGVATFGPPGFTPLGNIYVLRGGATNLHSVVSGFRFY